METMRLAGRLPANVLHHEATTERYFLKYKTQGAANVKNNLEEVVATLFKGHR